MGEKNIRKIGVFDVLKAPLNPIGAFNAEQFKQDARDMISEGSRKMIVDLGALDFLYSDAFNAFMLIKGELGPYHGSLGILTSDEVVLNTLNNAGINKSIKIYNSESEITEASSAFEAESKAKDEKAQAKKSVSVEATDLEAASKVDIPEEVTVPVSNQSPPTQVRRSGNAPSGGKKSSQRFVRSFSSSLTDNIELEDLNLPEDAESESKGNGMMIFLVILLLGLIGAGAWYYLNYMK